MRFRHQREASPLRDDIVSLEDVLAGYYDRKISLIHRLRDNAAAMASAILSGDESALEDVLAEDAHTIGEIEAVDFDIAKNMDRLTAATGLPGTELRKALFPKTDQGKRILEKLDTIRGLYAQTIALRAEQIGGLEKKMTKLGQSIDELSAMAKMRHLTPSKDPLL